MRALWARLEAVERALKYLVRLVGQQRAIIQSLEQQLRELRSSAQ